MEEECLLVPYQLQVIPFSFWIEISRNCHKLIWGVFRNHGYICQVCGYPAHKACKEKAPTYCGSNPSRSTAIGRQSIDEIVSSVVQEELYLVLKDSKTKDNFVQFCEKKYKTGALHVALWSAIEDYKELKSYIERKQTGTMIFRNFFDYLLYDTLDSFFLKDKPIFEIPIPEKIIKELRKRVDSESFDIKTFEELQDAGTFDHVPI